MNTNAVKTQEAVDAQEAFENKVGDYGLQAFTEFMKRCQEDPEIDRAFQRNLHAYRMQKIEKRKEANNGGNALQAD